MLVLGQAYYHSLSFVFLKNYFLYLQLDFWTWNCFLCFSTTKSRDLAYPAKNQHLYYVYFRKITLNAAKQ